MSVYLEPYILYVLGLLLFRFQADSASTILTLIVSLIALSLVIIPKNEYAKVIISGLYVAAGCFFPQLLPFTPAMSFPMVYLKKYNFSLIFIAPFLVALVRGNDYSALLWLPLAALAVYRAYSCRKNDDLNVKAKELRDAAAEHEMELSSKIRQLTVTQNDQIGLATMTERNRIAREIHDNVGHMLSRAILQVGALISVTKDPQTLAFLDSLKATLDSAMNNIRSSVHDLHDESVDLDRSLKTLCEEFTFCPVEYSFDADRHLPKDVKYCFIAITKEALNNIIKHSNATRVSVTVKEHPGFYRLQIHDNGTSYVEKKESGIGLSNMQDRVNALSGFINISHDNGFTITISIGKNKKEKREET